MQKLLAFFSFRKLITILSRAVPRENHTIVLNQAAVEKQGRQLKQGYSEKAIKVFSSEHQMEPLTFWIMYFQMIFCPKRSFSVFL